MFCICRCHLSTIYVSLVLPFIVCLALLAIEFCPVQYRSTAGAKKSRKFDHSDLTSLVISGQSVKEKTWPFMASLMFGRRSHYCGATIWSSEYILTAAHCMWYTDNTPIHVNDITVYVGHTELIHTDALYMFSVAEKIPHPNYTSFVSGNDIGLLRLTRPINFTTQDDYIQCVCRPSVAPSEIVRSRCYVAGWGTSDRFQPSLYTSMLQDALVPLLDDSYCKKRLSNEYILPQNSVFCAGYKDGQKDSCSGDSGGPLICAITRKKPIVYQQVGVVSFGSNCSQPDNPGYYTRVDHFRDWIKSVTGC